MKLRARGTLLAAWLGLLVASIAMFQASTPERDTVWHPAAGALIAFAENTTPSQESIVGCMTSGCHGSTDPDSPIWMRAGRIWFDSDPHAHAYTLLLSDASLKIAERLEGTRFVSSDDPGYRDFLQRRCTSCHSSPYARESQLVLGVDCQGCHGPSSAWGSHHYSVEWKAQGPDRFDGTSMIDTDNLATRSAACFSCHVGDQKSVAGVREVNHDLMGAGHPPMLIDFEGFYRDYPAHWRPEKDVERYGSTVAFRRWQIGNLTMAIARLNLLEQRCESAMADSKRPWPELTEYSCTSCHHDLEYPSWRQSRPANPTYDWDDWCVAGISASISTSQSAELDSMISQLKRSLEVAQPDPPKVMASAKRLRSFVEATLQSLQQSASTSEADVRDATNRMLSKSPTRLSWEEGIKILCGLKAAGDALQILPPDSDLRQSTAALLFDNIGSYTPALFEKHRQKFESLLRKRRP